VTKTVESCWFLGKLRGAGKIANVKELNDPTRCKFGMALGICFVDGARPVTGKIVVNPNERPDVPARLLRQRVKWELYNGLLSGIL
jgi:hypothetical protein